MSPREAVALLENATAQLNVNLQTHRALLQALDVLKNLIHEMKAEQDGKN